MLGIKDEAAEWVMRVEFQATIDKLEINLAKSVEIQRDLWAITAVSQSAIQILMQRLLMGVPVELQHVEIERFFIDVNRSVSNNIAVSGTFDPSVSDAARKAMAAFIDAFGLEPQKS